MKLKSKINIDLFYNISSPEVAYFLGFFWADGYIHKFKTGSTICSLEIKNSDYLKIKRNIFQLGQWNILKRKRKNSKNLFCRAYSGDKTLYEFLYNHGYESKSVDSPCQIISKIPEKLKPYFYRGWLDGDGFIQCDKKSNRAFVFTSSYSQDWKALKDICENLSIKYKIIKMDIKNRCKFSHFRISTNKDCIKFGHFIYYNYTAYPIGLTRKYKTFLDILDTNITNERLS